MKVRIETKYGVERIYPVCNVAKLFTQLIGQKTFTREQIELIKLLGYTIEVEQRGL